MTDIETHPTTHQLSAFAQGRLEEPEMDEIEEHLSSCDSCCRWIRALPDDSLVVKLRHRASATIAAPVPPQQQPAVDLPPGFQVPSSFILPPNAPHEQATVADPPVHRPPTLVPPKELSDHPRYRIVSVLGTGGMGTVFRAEHRLMARPVALKVIRNELLGNPALVERFGREVRSAARLGSHPNIVASYDAEQAGGTHILVMEFIEGIDLARLVERDGPLPASEACELIRQAALGLQYAFEDGMVHRDIKPQNLMRTTRGQLKILDFGLARFASEAGSHGGVTADGMILGSADYIAPEQIDDPHTADIRADIYSLGCTLYFLLAGQPPYPAGGLIQKLTAHREKSAQPLAEIRPDLPAELARIVERMMARAPEQRYQTPDEVARALVPFLNSQRAGTHEMRLDAPGGGDQSSSAIGSFQAAMATTQKPSTERTSAGSQLRGPRARRTALLAMLPIAAVCLALIVYRIRTDTGEIIVETDDPNIEVVVKQGGRQVTILDPKTKDRIVLNSGNYEFQLAGDGAGLQVSPGSCTLKRGEKAVVTVRHEPLGAPVANGPYGTSVPESTSDTVLRRSLFLSSHDLPDNAFLLPDNRHVLYSTGGDYQSDRLLPGTDPALWLADLTSLTDPPRKFTGHEPGFISLAVSRDGRVVVSASEDQTLRTWNLEDGRSRLILHENEPLGAVAVSADGRQAAYMYGKAGNEIRLCNLSGAVAPRTLYRSPLSIARIAFCAGGRRIVAGIYDHTIRVWDVETGRELQRMACMSSVRDLAVFPNDRRLIALEERHTRILDLETGEELRRIPVTGTCVAVSCDGQRVLLGHDLVIDVWDLKGAETIARFQGHTQMVQRVGFSPDGQRAVSTSLDRSVRIWQMPPPPLQPVAAVLPLAHAKLDELEPAEPTSSRTQAILDALDQIVPLNFEDATLSSVLNYIKVATFNGKKPTDPGLPIYVDPRVERALASKVRIEINGARLRLGLELLLKQVNLDFIVKDDVLIISSPQGIEQERNERAHPAADASPRTKQVLARLEQPLPMSFPGLAPLDELLNYVRQAMTTPRDRDGIPFVTDPAGLKKAGCSLTSTVSIDLDGVPLKTSLRLVLKQLRLAYVVRDGCVVISSAEELRKH